MPQNKLVEFIEKLNVDSETFEGYLMEIALYSDGVITYADLRQMPVKRVKQFEEKLSDKIKSKAGKKGTEYL